MNDRFEIEVSEMLTEHAKVDRSTLELTRASIATLPDRKPRRMFRLRSWMPGLPAGGRRAFVFVGVAGVVVALVAVSLFGRFDSAPVGPGSPTPSVATPLATASPSPSISPQPLPTARATAAFPETLPVLYTGGMLTPVGWSPDGSRFAIFASAVTNFGVIADPTAHLFDKAGTEIQALKADRFAWLDASNFVILRLGAVADGKYEAYRGSVGSAQLTDLGEYYSLVAGPSGAVALMGYWDPATAAGTQYIVVSAISVSAPRNGYPAGWSRDGSMLALFHPTGATDNLVGGSSGGWVEVVRSTGESVASARQVFATVTTRIAFSPDGARVAFRDDTNVTTKGEEIGVLDLKSGHLTDIPRIGTFSWASNTDLLFDRQPTGPSDVPSEENTILSWSATTGKLSIYAQGDFVTASGSGMVIFGSDVTHSLSWIDLTSASAKGALSLGSGPYLGAPDSPWSPDGKSVILIAGDKNNPSSMDAVLFRP